MDASVTRNMQPDDLAVFKELKDNGAIQIPELSRNRVPTDKKYIAIFVAMVLLLVPCLIDTLSHSKYRELVENTKKLKDNNCSTCIYIYGIGYAGDPYYSDGVNYRFGNHSVQYQFRRRRDTDSNKKIKEHHYQDVDVRKFLNAAGGRIILACFSSLALSIAMLFLFRVTTAAIVWSILAGVITFGILIAGFLWYRYVQLQETGRDLPGLIILPIIWTVLLVIMVLLVVFLAKKINLVIAMLREATKAVFAMPQLVAIPLVTFFFQLTILALFGITHFYMSFSGTLWYSGWTHVPIIEPSNFMSFTKLFNLWMAFWSFQVIEGIQYMVVAGAVTRWYFVNNKNRLNSPIFRSASITLRFHLGSIIFGAMFITFVSIIRRTINFLTGNKIGKLLCDFCLKPTEDFLRFLNKNAFILTAMHGQPFFKSGQRATQIIYKNALNVDVASVNFIGDFVLCMARLLLIFVSLLFTYLILQESPLNWIAYIIVAMFAMMVSNIWFAVFETTIDTILLCFCEDSLLNDGLERPYAMSRDLMQFVENSKRLFEKKG